ncbi:ferrochelatase [Candidatus Nanopelagicales bacterium]|nr:ferrochelatase [Candidatus Nanopelagicales bacterium]
MIGENVDALLVLSFGGPESPDEVMPFLRQVTAGKAIPEARLAAVAEQYWAFDGVSPLNGENRDLVARLQAQMPKGQPVYLGNRNSEPFLSDTLKQMQSDGVRSAAVFVTSAFGSYSGCRQYRENLAVAAATLPEPMDLQLLNRIADDDTLAQIWALELQKVWPSGSPCLFFVTHSIPISNAEKYVAEQTSLANKIVAQLEDTGTAVGDWELAYQSRSGPPSQPWLEPDIGEAITAATQRGAKSFVVAPIGFLAENLEIAWDLDRTAAQVCADLGVAYYRGQAPQRSEKFVDLILQLLAAPTARCCAADCCPNPRASPPSWGDCPD